MGKSRRREKRKEQVLHGQSRRLNYFTQQEVTAYTGRLEVALQWGNLDRFLDVVGELEQEFRRRVEGGSQALKRADEVSLEDAGISSRSALFLNRWGIFTVSDLAGVTREWLSAQDQFAELSVEQVVEAARRYSVDLRGGGKLTYRKRRIEL